MQKRLLRRGLRGARAENEGSLFKSAGTKERTNEQPSRGEEAGIFLSATSRVFSRRGIGGGDAMHCTAQRPSKVGS